MHNSSKSSDRENRQDAKPSVGWPGTLQINPVSVLFYLLLAGVVVLVVWRVTGYEPWRRSLSAAPRAFSRAYVLLGVHKESVYYFDRHSEKIVRFDSAHPDAPVEVGFLPSLEATVPSMRGDKIAIVSHGRETWLGLYVFNLAMPGDPRLVTSREAGFPAGYALRPDSAVAWSPDDQYIAFVAYKDDCPDLFVARVDGQAVRRLTYHEANIGTVAWMTPQSLVFVSDWEGQDRLYRINHDGGDLRSLK